MSEHTATPNTPGPAHPPGGAPSPWVTRFAALIPPGGTVLDLACGSGRHARWLAAQGFKVEAVDRDAAALAGLVGVEGVHTRLIDLEGADWPLAGRRYDAAVVSNYLYRPRFAELLAGLGEGGVLIYETFMRGNERFGKPSNPDFLLQPGELLERVRPDFSVVAFEQGEVEWPKPAGVQRICAVRTSDLAEMPRLP
jgi:SAM-dependent methyltransferase